MKQISGVITPEEAKARGISPKSLLQIAEWNEERAKATRNRRVRKRLLANANQLRDTVLDLLK